MGGGGAMRAAAKVAGLGVFNSGLRGIVPENTVSTAVRKAARPITGLASPRASDNVVNGAADTYPVSPVHSQKARWEMDDWELAGGEKDLFSVSSGVSTPTRLVFGGPPSLDEATAATYELKEALEKAYLTPPTTPSKSGWSAISPPTTPTRSGWSGISRSEVKDCVTSEIILAPAVPPHAIQAFKFLNESPAVQSVVASIASDPNVWEAVLLNPALQDYIHSQKINKNGAPSSAIDDYDKSSTADSDVSPGSVSSDCAKSASGESVPSGVFMNFWQELKVTVEDMVNSLFDYFQTWFGGFSGDKEAADVNGGFLEKALGPSLMGLAVIVMMVVVLRRA